MREKLTLYDSLVKISNVERAMSIPNSDSNNANPIDQTVFDKTRDMLFKLINQPSIVPTTNNSIQLTYHNNDGAYLEFEVFSDKVKMFFYAETVYIRILDNLNNINWMVINFLCRNYSPIINYRID